MTGTITSIEDYGTIVMVWLDTGGDIRPVYFDHRPFRHLLESENCDPTDLIGRVASFKDETLSFEV